jgi:hypothetical protein
MNELDSIIASSDEALFLLIAPAALVWLLGLLMQTTWSALTKQLVAYAAYAVTAAAWLFYRDQTLFSWDGLPRLFLLVAVVGTLIYRLWATPVKEAELRTSR